ncbi:MAG: glycosyltransferase family 2 protein, partial [Longimicrobiales bacterium]
MSAPLVSVIIPTYNRMNLLRQAVQSVRAQSYEHWELIVVDDGSTDGTRAFLEGLADSKVRLISMSHSGVTGAVRNAGAHAARGDYLAFLDSDDLWLPAKLETQLAQMQKSGVRWSYTRYEHIDEQGRSIPPKAGVWEALSGDIAREVVNAEASVVICTVVVDKRLFFAAGPFVEEAGPYREDYDL